MRPSSPTPSARVLAAVLEPLLPLDVLQSPAFEPCRILKPRNPPPRSLRLTVLPIPRRRPLKTVHKALTRRREWETDEGEEEQVLKEKREGRNGWMETV